MESRASTSMAMPPPPPRPPKASPSLSEAQQNSSADSRQLSDAVVQDMDLKQQTSEQKSAEVLNGEQKDNATLDHTKSAVLSDGLYQVPPWSAAPLFPFSLEVIKEGLVIDTLNVSLKGAYMFGRSDRCDFMLEHPTISRYHAVLQFKRNGDAYIYDLGSTHGTFVNKKQVLKKAFVPVHVGDVIKLGLSTRLYLLQGPVELMPKDPPTKTVTHVLREVQSANDHAEREASLWRVRRDMEGATWGMMEDAVEEDIQEEEEVTWQTYKGQLTEKQQKTLEKIQKRNEKLSSLKREIDAIQVKEIPQGGLTQGQQTQIARNERRIEQLMEELENLEETLNQSIQESIGARAGRLSKRRGEGNEEEDLSDEDDEFYDRTNSGRKKSSKMEVSAPVVETAESLLEKRENLMNDIEKLSELLETEEKSHVAAASETCPAQTTEFQDPLDAFMTSVSSKLVEDRAYKIRKEMEKQQAELDRIIFLLKVADPSGEALEKWQLEPRLMSSPPQTLKQAAEKTSEKLTNSNVNHAKQDMDSKTDTTKESINAVSEVSQEVQKQVDKGEQKVSKGALWLGHAREKEVEKENAIDLEEILSSKDFLEYKDRKNANSKLNQIGSLQTIPEDAEGLVLRTSKNISKENAHGKDCEQEKTAWDGAAAAAADTIALLLRHQKGLGAVEEEMQKEKTCSYNEDLPNTAKKRKLGPEKPPFLSGEDIEFQAWVPPEGQTGDGRTSLNDKYGY